MAFVKGKSGNPGGRPKDVAQIAKLSRKYTKEAVLKLVDWMRSDNPKASVSACQALLDRGWGKATQPLSGPEGGPIETRNVTEIVERGVTPSAPRD